MNVPAIPQQFIPDILLPAQYYGGRVHTRGRGEKQLMWAVLEDAIMCVEGNLTASPTPVATYRAAEEAYVWFMDNDMSYPFAFAAICDTLDLSDTSIRAYADAVFQRLTPVRRKHPPQIQSGPKATASVRSNKKRIARKQPAWLPVVEVRDEGHVVWRGSVSEYACSEEEARTICAAYIAAGEWKATHLQPVIVKHQEGTDHDERGI